MPDIIKENPYNEILMNFWQVQGKTIGDFIQRFPPGSERLQRLNSNTLAFQRELRVLLAKHSLGTDYASEQTTSEYGYLSGYKKLDPVSVQLQKLQAFFSVPLTANLKIAQQPLPEGAEGYLVLPNFRLLAPTYGGALERVLSFLNTQRNRKFRNFREGKLGENFLRQSEVSIVFWETVAAQQGGYNTLIIPVQLGLLFRGCSVNRSRFLCEVNDQVGLGAYYVAIALLTHPIRLQHYDDLWIDCPGDEYSSGGGALFGRAPFFSFGVGELRFGASDVSVVRSSYGSASAFPRSIIDP